MLLFWCGPTLAWLIPVPSKFTPPFAPLNWPPLLLPASPPPSLPQFPSVWGCAAPSLIAAQIPVYILLPASPTGARHLLFPIPLLEPRNRIILPHIPPAALVPFAYSTKLLFAFITAAISHLILALVSCVLVSGCNLVATHPKQTSRWANMSTNGSSPLGTL